MKIKHDLTTSDNSFSCCSKLSCAKKYTTAEVCAIRNFFSKLPPADQQQWIFNRTYLHEKSKTGRKGRLLDSPQTARGLTEASPLYSNYDPLEKVTVCQEFFLFVTGLAKRTLHNSGKGTSPLWTSHLVRRKTLRVPYKKLLGITTILEYTKCNGNRFMPDSDMICVNEMSWSDVAQACHKLLESKNDLARNKIPSVSTMRKLLLHDPHLNHIRLRRWIPFSKCDTCTSLRNQIAETRDYKHRKILVRQLNAHLNEMSEERHSYYIRIAKAILNPEYYESIIVDGMDNKLNELPHEATMTSEGEKCWKLPIHVMGAIAHGRQAFTYLIPDHVKLGHNVTIECIHQVLLDRLHSQRFQKLAPVLFVQLDNTVRQCKGKYLFAYLGILVETGVLQKVIVSFLKKSHTHEDIDQMFSRFAIRLRQERAHSREQLASVLKLSYRPRDYPPLKVCNLDAVANISGWLESICPAFRLNGVTKWHQFRIFKKDDTAHIQCRQTTVDGKGDSFRWGAITSDEKKDAISTPIFGQFPNGRCPEILPGMNMPAAQRRKLRAPVKTITLTYQRGDDAENGEPDAKEDDALEDGEDGEVGEDGDSEENAGQPAGKKKDKPKKKKAKQEIDPGGHDDLAKNIGSQYRSGLMKLQSLYKIKSDDMNDLNQVLKLMEGTESIPFHWTDEEIELLYLKQRATRCEDNAGAVEEYLNEKQIKPDQVWAWKNPNFDFFDDSKNINGELPFEMGKILSCDKDSAGNSGAYIRRYIMQGPQRKRSGQAPRDWKTTQWCLETLKGRAESSYEPKDFCFQEKQVLQAEVSLSNQGKMKQKSVKCLSFYLEMWRQPQLVEDWPPDKGTIQPQPQDLRDFRSPTSSKRSATNSKRLASNSKRERTGRSQYEQGKPT